MEGCCEHGNEPSGSINIGKFLRNCTTGGFSRRAQPHGVSQLVRQVCQCNDNHIAEEARTVSIIANRCLNTGLQL
jgi:hypothetical protein